MLGYISKIKSLPFISEILMVIRSGSDHWAIQNGLGHFIWVRPTLAFVLAEWLGFPSSLNTLLKDFFPSKSLCSI
jgi:hypothetical protein